MNEISAGKTINPVAYLFKVVINKFRQQADMYPIKYYKKKGTIVKTGRLRLYKCCMVCGIYALLFFRKNPIDKKGISF